jgi:allantoinase
MTHYDLIIRNGIIVTEAALLRADLAVSEGRVAAIEPELSGSAGETIDAAGLHLFPGGIDPHVHCNEPGRTEWEGFASATAALAAGGVTSLIDMPLNAHPPTCDAAAFDAKLAAAEQSALIDFALWGGLVPGNLEQLDQLAERGVAGFKAFMSTTGTDDFAPADDLTLYEGMRRAARLGRLVAVHAENRTITDGLARQAQAEGRAGARDYLASRPVVAETEAIQRAIALAEDAGCALHIVHVSSGRGVALVAEARQRGVDVSCETCPHYLVLTEEDVERIGAVAKCAPPIRPAGEVEALWEHIQHERIPIVASDHSPAPAALKQGDDFFAIWGGIAGCQSTLALLITEGHARRGLALARVAGLTAGGAAQRFGLAPAKGCLAPGADADIAIVDVAHEAELRAEDLLYRHTISPYIGMRLRGRVARTILRGATVLLDGAVVARGHGHFLAIESR